MGALAPADWSIPKSIILYKVRDRMLTAGVDSRHSHKFSHYHL